MEVYTCGWHRLGSLIRRMYKALFKHICESWTFELTEFWNITEASRYFMVQRSSAVSAEAHNSTVGQPYKLHLQHQVIMPAVSKMHTEDWKLVPNMML